jgi:DDE family transposase
MATLLSEVAEALQIVFTSTANAAADRTGFVQRTSKMTGAAFVQALTFGWLANPQATLEELAQAAGTAGVSVSPQALEQRFTPQATACLLEVLEAAVARVLTADPVAVPILQRFPGGVTVLDSTTIALPEALASRWPGCAGATSAAGGRASLKLQVRWDLLRGTLHGPSVHAGRSSDRRSPMAQAPLPEGTLHLADGGYFRVLRLQELSAEGVFWLSRLLPRTALYRAAEPAQTITALLANERADVVDVPVRMGKKHRLPCRLLAVRVSPAVAAHRRECVQRTIRRRHRQTDPDCWTMTEWTVYVTNVPATMLTLPEALVLARCRWQIELLFKLWKTYGRIDESRSEQPWHVLCEVYAKLLGMVVQHWILLVSCWSYPDRSLAKAAGAVRRQALNLLAVIAQRQLVARTLEIIQRSLQRGCRVNRRVQGPSTFQLLLDLTEGG